VLHHCPDDDEGIGDMTIINRPEYTSPEYRTAPLELPGLNVPYAMTRTDRVPAQRYYDPEFYAMENELLWPRVWQMACYLAEIPNPGDYITYRILDKEVVVVRVDETSVRAFHNACRHRGVALVEGRGNVSSGFICPFHGWCFGLDGANTFMYQPDLFHETNRDPKDLALVPCRVETWGGSAFINLDENAPPLRDFLGPFADLHDVWKVEALWPEWWLSFRMPTNWKLAMEAFMEGYHVMQSHPQLLSKKPNRQLYVPLGGSTRDPMQRARRQILGTETFDRDSFIKQQLNAYRTLSVGMAGMMHQKDVVVAEGLSNIDLPETFEEALPTWNKAVNDSIMEWHQHQGIDMPDLNYILSTGLGVSSVNFCFPHYFLLPAYSSASSYRIRPLGPEECLFELWSLTRYPKGQEPPAPPEPTPWAPDDPRIPSIPSQDFSNLPRQQRGLHAKGFEYLRLSNWVEGMVSNNHRLIDGYLAGLPDEKLLAAIQQVVGPIDADSRYLGF
jgi:phenylpropionate dioxygenase-like ring-hydroxylating dioxygenase large terminal subunit